MLETEDCCSRLQLAEHPSPLTVFPSSHSSLPTENQSPQIVLQTLMSLVQTLPPAHVHPFSTTQSGEHPSPLTVFPSSQYSKLSIKPSPQTWTSQFRCASCRH